MISELWEVLAPPADASPEVQMRHRTLIAIAVLGCLSFIPISFTRFALAGEVEGVKGTVAAIQVQLVEQSLLDARLRQCKADTAETKQYYYERLQEKMNLYFELVGRNWKAPACVEVL